jgi:spore coat protein A
MMTRRQLLKTSAATGVALSLPCGIRPAYPFAQSPTTIPLFGTTLRGIGTIGVAAVDLTPAPITGVTHYTINIDQFQDAGVCPTLGPTTLRGFNPTRLLAGQNNRHLGGIIVGQKGTPIQITFRNNLPPGTHIIPNDLTIPHANEGNNRTAVHLHGGLVPWVSDGGPFSWWDPNGNHGVSFLNNQVLRSPGTAAANEAEYYYPLNQSARFVWYHDHAIGITRINAYAGIASGLLIRDTFELNLVNQGLPNYIEAGGNEIPLIFQDKVFVGANIAAIDPTWSVVSSATTPGSLWYAHVYERARWKSAGNLNGGNLIPPDPSCIPEFFGDTMLVNGTVFPKVTVQARRYRLRLLNACNARFLNLQLYVADGSPNGITLNPATGIPTNSPAACDPNNPGLSAFVLQIGTEGGFLPKPAQIPTSIPFNPLLPLKSSLVVAPAERPDVLIDFSAHSGKSIILYNDAPAPFPVGAPVNDYFPGWNAGNSTGSNLVNRLTPAGFGPNTRVLMRFDVVPTTGTDLALNINTGTDLSPGIDAPLVPFGSSIPPANVPVRQLTLNETFDLYGRLIQMLGTLVPPGSPSAGFGQPYEAPATEVVQHGTTEVWEIFNTTADVHPMHFHLVNVQLINRQPFQVSSLGNTKGGVNFTGPATPAEPNETGWKETVMMFPGTVTRIIMRFDLPTVPFTVPESPRTGGNEYVWHCHILEHEEHDMMRPLVVT